MSEAKAQAELLKNKYLEQIGSYYNIINPEDLPVSDGILLYYGKLFNDEIAKQLKIHRTHKIHIKYTYFEAKINLAINRFASGCEVVTIC